MSFGINSLIVNRGVSVLSERVVGADEAEVREAVYAVLVAALEPEDDDVSVHRALYDLVVLERDRLAREVELLRGES